MLTIILISTIINIVVTTINIIVTKSNLSKGITHSNNVVTGNGNIVNKTGSEIQTPLGIIRPSDNSLETKVFNFLSKVDNKKLSQLSESYDLLEIIKKTYNKIQKSKEVANSKLQNLAKERTLQLLEQISEMFENKTDSIFLLLLEFFEEDYGNLVAKRTSLIGIPNRSIQDSQNLQEIRIRINRLDSIRTLIKGSLNELSGLLRSVNKIHDDLITINTSDSLSSLTVDNELENLKVIIERIKSEVV